MWVLNILVCMHPDESLVVLHRARNAVLLQILTARQQAVCIAKAFPYIADDPRTFELIAARRLEVPLSVLTQPPGLDDFEHNTNWSRVANYLKTVTKSNLHEHNQLVSN